MTAGRHCSPGLVFLHIFLTHSEQGTAGLESKGQAYLLSSIIRFLSRAKHSIFTLTKSSHSLSSWFLFYNTAYGYCVGAPGTDTKNADTLATALAVSNALSFISDSGVLCLLPVSKKL